MPNKIINYGLFFSIFISVSSLIVSIYSSKFVGLDIGNFYSITGTLASIFALLMTGILTVYTISSFTNLNHLSTLLLNLNLKCDKITDEIEGNESKLFKLRGCMIESVLDQYTAMIKFYNEIELNMPSAIGYNFNTIRRDFLFKRAIIGLKSNSLNESTKYLLALDLVALKTYFNFKDTVEEILKCEQSTNIRLVLNSIYDP